MVIFENVSKVYPDGTIAVEDLNLKVAKGELIVLIGSSGCGKTTTLKMINRLEECSSGKIYVGGEDISTVDPVELRRGIGYVIQDIGLMPHMTVGENIAIVPQLLKWNKKKIAMRTGELLEMAGLSAGKYKHRLPKQMSGGQKQRIGVLRALAAEPDVVLMDEPFGALDPISRDNLQNELMDLQKKLKKTIIFVTHDIDESLKLADRIVIMRHGKVEQIGTPDEIKNQPINNFVKTFIGENRLSEITADTSVEVLVEEPFVKVTPDVNASYVLEKLVDMGRESAQVVDDDDNWLGMVLMTDIKKVSSNINIKELLRLKRRLYIEEATLENVADILSEDDLPIPIISQDNKFMGVVTDNGMARLTISRLKSKKVV